jgi:hypothetical protein
MRYLKFVTTQVQGSIVPGSGLINIKNRGFQTINHEPANLSRYVKIIKTGKLIILTLNHWF